MVIALSFLLGLSISSTALQISRKGEFPMNQISSPMLERSINGCLISALNDQRRV